MKHTYIKQRGSSLIEVLVAVLILSFGLLALGAMVAYAVQLPKLSAYRATGAVLAASHIERMRANVTGFALGSYVEAMTFNQTLPVITACVYPACTTANIVELDKDETNRSLRRDLPLGGMRVVCNGACANNEGDIWIMWQEPATSADLNSSRTDECPTATDAPTFTAFSSPGPRCLHFRFKL